MSSPYKTGTLDEALIALPEIEQLAKDVLKPEEFEEANQLANMLIKKKLREYAIKRLMLLLRPPPSRPLFYCMHEIKGLPRWTRNAIRYLGDYIDILVKEMTYEFTRKVSARKSSLGINIKTLESRKDLIPVELLTNLRRYNDFLYTPGKHDIQYKLNRIHRFTSKEVVLTAFITINLANRIKSISKLAQRAAEDKHDYMINVKRTRGVSWRPSS